MSEKMHEVFELISPQGDTNAYVIRQLDAMLGDMLVSRVAGMTPIELVKFIKDRRVSVNLAATIDYNAVVRYIFEYLRCMGFMSSQRR